MALSKYILNDSKLKMHVKNSVGVRRNVACMNRSSPKYLSPNRLSRGKLKTSHDRTVKNTIYFLCMSLLIYLNFKVISVLLFKKGFK